MSDLLKRIDPDGTLVEAVRHWTGLYESAPEVLRAILVELSSRKALRDPDEPTLAEIREKVEALHFGASTNANREIGDHPRVLARERAEAYARVLALLEPRKPEPEPEPRFRVTQFSENPSLWLILDMGLDRQVASSGDERDARRIAEALDALHGLPMMSASESNVSAHHYERNTA